MELSKKQAIVLWACVILLTALIGLKGRRIEETYDFDGVKGSVTADLVYFYGLDTGKKVISALPEKAGSRTLAYRETKKKLYWLMPLAKYRYYLMAVIAFAGILLFNKAAKTN